MVKLKKQWVIFLLLGVFLFYCDASEIKYKGVEFPFEKSVAGKVLKLNSPCARVEFALTAYVIGLYLEKPSNDLKEVVESNQVKQLVLHFKTNLGTSNQVKKAIVDSLKETNPPELLEKHQKDIDSYLSLWDKGMVPDQAMVITYIPEKGLHIQYLNDTGLVIPGKEFADMLFRANFVDEKLKKACRFI